MREICFLVGSRAAALAIGFMLSGCAMSDDTMARFLVPPGQYALYTCEELADQEKAVTARMRELEQLMARAEVDSAGQFVSTAVYKSDYLTARGELNEVRNAAVAKNCEFAAGRTSDKTIR